MRYVHSRQNRMRWSQFSPTTAQASTLSSDDDMPASFPSLVRRILPSASNATIAAIQSLYSYPLDLPEKLAWDWTSDAVFLCHTLALMKKYERIAKKYMMSIPPAIHGQDLSCTFSLGHTRLINTEAKLMCL